MKVHEFLANFQEHVKGFEDAEICFDYRVNLDVSSRYVFVVGYETATDRYGIKHVTVFLSNVDDSIEVVERGG